MSFGAGVSVLSINGRCGSVLKSSLKAAIIIAILFHKIKYTCFVLAYFYFPNICMPGGGDKVSERVTFTPPIHSTTLIHSGMQLRTFAQIFSMVDSAFASFGTVFVVGSKQISNWQYWAFNVKLLNMRFLFIELAITLFIWVSARLWLPAIS